MNEERIEKICNLLEEIIPSPTTELNFKNHFTFLVAVVLSARTTDKQVNKVTETLFKVIETPQDIISMGYGNFCELIKTIGLYKNKAKNILKLSEQLINDYNSIVPNNKKDLINLAGVGGKTANVVLSQLFHLPAIAVDTHVFRVSRRLELSDGHTPEKVEQDLNNTIPEKYKLHIGDRILLHGRYTCIARKPKCNECKLRNLCNFESPL